MTIRQLHDPHAHIPGVSFHLTDYQPAWRDFERACGTMADDECEHGRTPLERERNPGVCACTYMWRTRRARAAISRHVPHIVRMPAYPNIAGRCDTAECWRCNPQNVAR